MCYRKYPLCTSQKLLCLLQSIQKVQKLSQFQQKNADQRISISVVFSRIQEYSLLICCSESILVSYMNPGSNIRPNAAASSYLPRVIALSKAMSNVFTRSKFNGWRTFSCRLRQIFAVSKSAVEDSK